MKSTRNRSRLADQGTKEMLPVIFSLAWPTMLEQLMQTAVQYMDTGMVGVLGTSATAAVGATSTVNWLIGSTISAISIGFLAYISQSIGAGKKEQAKKDIGRMLDYVDKLNELDTADVEPMSHVFPVHNVFREDVVTNGDDRENMLKNAPAVKDGSWKVPKTVE